MKDAKQLADTLRRIDGRGYKAYKDITGAYAFNATTLYIDHVQGDPFAAPSKVRIRVAMKAAALPDDLYDNPTRCLALEDVLARQVARAIREVAEGGRGSGKSGLITMDAGGQEVLERTAVVVTEDWAEARLQVELPARGRSVLGRQAEVMLCDELPEIAEAALRAKNLPMDDLRHFVETVENHAHIQGQLAERGLVAFVADGAVLPRASGASDRPMRGGAVVPFETPEALRVTFEVPNPANGEKTVHGLGVPRGVTLIVGGGYHGKSTLLRAIERGVYPHVPEDGREYVVSEPMALKVRAEDGRRVEAVDISPFIGNLPHKKGTAAFRTDDASGSTSQAASIVEAVEMGAKVLLLDEDTSATNFMVRDARMQALVAKEHEPITPFIDCVRELFEKLGVSTVLVMGGCGDYFDVADTVIMMHDYLPDEATKAARQVAEKYPSGRMKETPAPLEVVRARVPQSESFDPSRGRKDVKIDVRDIDEIRYGAENIDLRGVEQLVDLSQTRAVGHAIHLAAARYMDGKKTLREVLDDLATVLEEEGLDMLDPFHKPGRHPGNYARPRMLEVGAAMNRLRTVKMKQA